MRRAASQKRQRPRTLTTTTTPTEPTPAVVVRGRPRAKRSNPEYQQVTAYMRRKTYAAARKLLIDAQLEFSELVEQLVREWVHSHEH